MSRLCSCGLQVQPQVHLMDVLAAPAWRWPLVECNPFTFTHVGVVVSGESGSDPVPFCLCPLCARLPLGPMCCSSQFGEAAVCVDVSAIHWN
jgi:hypothetical protein